MECYQITYDEKRVITIGLIILATGSIVLPELTQYIWLLPGCMLQDGGVIPVAIMALTADLTSNEYCTKTMASIGISIGMSFIIALTSGSALEYLMGLSGILWDT